MGAEVIAKIDAYLFGSKQGKAVAEWATSILAASRGEDELIEEALAGLANLDHGTEELDTPKEDLEFYRDCLSGKREFDPAVLVQTERAKG